MLDISKAVVTVDKSEETLAKFDKRLSYSNATSEERRKMADAEQEAWDAENLNDVKMP